MAVAFQVNTDAALNAVRQLIENLSPEVIDQTADRAAYRVLGEVIPLTPKKWFGQVRRGWTVDKVQDGSRRVYNPNKIMRFLERGTANGGAGYIEPDTAKALFIPLTRKAAAGYTEGLIHGRDYIFRKRVRGIKPRKIIENFRPRAMAILREEMEGTLRHALQIPETAA